MIPTKQTSVWCTEERKMILLQLAVRSRMQDNYYNSCVRVCAGASEEGTHCV